MVELRYCVPDAKNVEREKGFEPLDIHLGKVVLYQLSYSRSMCFEVSPVSDTSKPFKIDSPH